MGAPSLPRRVAFWVLLGLFSASFAEVTFPNTPFDPLTMLLFAGPIYTLHAVVLLGVVFRTDRVDYPSLYLVGVVLGLYEAYVTKVVWAPVGDPIPVQVLGVYPLETLSLVLFWHPLMALVVPVAVVEWAATDSSRTLGPPIAGHRFALPLAVLGGLLLAVFQGALGAAPLLTVVSTVLALSVLGAAVLGWRLTGGHRYGMGALLPDGRELVALAGGLVGLYLLFGATLRPEALPLRPGPHLVVLVVYGIVGAMLLVALRRRDDSGDSIPVRFTWRRALGAAGAFVLASAVASLALAPVADFVFLAFFALAPLAGVANLGGVALRILASGVGAR